MLRQLLHWRGRVPGTKALNPPPPVPSREQLQQVWKIVSAGIEVPGLDTATTSSTSVHALKKGHLQIKSGSGLYMAMEFHTCILICAQCTHPSGLCIQNASKSQCAYIILSHFTCINTELVIYNQTCPIFLQYLFISIEEIISHAYCFLLLVAVLFAHSTCWPQQDRWF